MGLKRNISWFTHLFYKYFNPTRIKRWNTLNFLINNVENNAELPKDLKFGHGGGTVIGSETKFGKNVFIGQNVTFGSKRNSRLWRGRKRITARELEKEVTFPIIEDNVKIHANCIIVGGIRIGRNSVIAPNCFINQNIPPDSLVFPKQELVIRRMDRSNINHWNEPISFKEEDKDKKILVPK